MAVLILLGICLLLVAFLAPGPFPVQPAFWGCFVLVIAGLWIYWDNKTAKLTPDQETDRLLVQCVKRSRELGSIDAVVNEFRNRGASDRTLSMVENAPTLVASRARGKIQSGASLLTLGILLSVGCFFTSKVAGASSFAVAVGAVGAGVGLLLTGLIQLRFLRRNMARTAVPDHTLTGCTGPATDQYR